MSRFNLKGVHLDFEHLTNYTLDFLFKLIESLFYIDEASVFTQNFYYFDSFRSFFLL